MDAKFRRSTQRNDEHQSERGGTIPGAGAWKTQHRSTGGNTSWTSDMVFLNRARGFESRRGFQFPVITPDTDTGLHGQSKVQKTARLARGSVVPRRAFIAPSGATSAALGLRP